MKLQRKNKYVNKITRGIASMLLAGSILTCSTNIISIAEDINVEETDYKYSVKTLSVKDKYSINIQKSDKNTEDITDKNTEEVVDLKLLKYQLKYPYANWSMNAIMYATIKDSNNNYRILPMIMALSEKKDIAYFYDLFTEEELFEIPFNCYFLDFFEINEIAKCENIDLSKVIVKCKYLEDKEIIGIGMPAYEYMTLSEIDPDYSFYSSYKLFKKAYKGRVEYNEYFLTTQKMLENYVKFVPDKYRITSEDMNLKPVYREEDKLFDSFKITEEEISQRIEKLCGIDMDIEIPISTISTLVFKDSNDSFKVMNVKLVEEGNKMKVIDIYTDNILFYIPIIDSIKFDPEADILSGMDLNTKLDSIPYFEDKKLCYFSSAFGVKGFLYDNYDEICEHDGIKYRNIPETMLCMVFPPSIHDMPKYMITKSDYAKLYVSLPEDMFVTAKELGFEKEKVDSIMLCTKLVEVEDLYRPYKEKKKTKATEAIKNGLEPLAKIIMSFPKNIIGIDKFLNDSVKTKEDALTGAKYIIAEWISLRI